MIFVTTWLARVLYATSRARLEKRKKLVYSKTTNSTHPLPEVAKVHVLNKGVRAPPIQAIRPRYEIFLPLPRSMPAMHWCAQACPSLRVAFAAASCCAR